MLLITNCPVTEADRFQLSERHQTEGTEFAFAFTGAARRARFQQTCRPSQPPFSAPPGCDWPFPGGRALEPSVLAPGNLSGIEHQLACLRAFCAGIGRRGGLQGRKGRAACNPDLPLPPRLMENRCLCAGPEHGMEMPSQGAFRGRGPRLQPPCDPASKQLFLRSSVYTTAA